MDKLKKLMGSLLARAWATEAEKAKVKTMLKELTAEEQEEAKDDAQATDDLPTTDPATDEDEDKGDEDKGEEDETVKSIVGSLNKKIDSKIASAMKAIDDSVQELKKNLAQTPKANALVFDKEKYADFAKAMKGEAKKSVTFELKDFDFRAKVVGDISEDNSITGELPQAELEPGASRDAQRNPFIQDLVSVGTITSNLDAWIETTGEEGDPLPVAELATMPQKDYDFARFTAEVKKIAVYAKYSKEMAEDLPSLVSDIKNFLVTDLNRVVDTQLLSGDGTGENLIGLLTNAITYSSAGFTGTILDANRYDVIETAVAQMTTALHQPSHIAMHPIDVAKLRLEKGTDGHYVMPPFIASDGTVISGVRVVSNTGITAGNFLLGDFKKASVKFKRGVTMEMTNTDQDDFIKDRFTVKVTTRLVQRVRANDYDAFIYGNFATAIIALNTTS